MSEYSVEEVRAGFEAVMREAHYLFTWDDATGDYEETTMQFAWIGYQAAYAERIKANEGAVPVAVRYFDGKNGDGSQHYVVYSLDRHRANVGAEPLFTHPPAQAAQVDGEGKLLVEVSQRDADNYCRILSLLGMEEEGDPVAEVGLLIAARDAEPVAQSVDVGKVREVIASIDLRAETYLDPQCKGWADNLTAALQEPDRG